MAQANDLRSTSRQLRQPEHRGVVQTDLARRLADEAVSLEQALDEAVRYSVGADLNGIVRGAYEQAATILEHRAADALIGYGDNWVTKVARPRITEAVTS